MLDTPILVLVALLSVASAAVCDVTLNSGDPCYSLCAQRSSVIEYTKYDYFPVCIEFIEYSPDSTHHTKTTKGRMVHYPNVDEFSELNMEKTSGFTNLFDPNTNVGADAVIKVYTTGKDANGNPDVVESPESIPYFGQGDKSHVVLYYYTALVEMDEGAPVGITWQYGDCSGCDDAECLPDVTFASAGGSTYNRNAGSGKACGWSPTACTGTTASADACQPKTYVAFKGTDKKGIRMTSSGSMLPRFSSYGLGKTYSNLRNKV